MPDLRNPAGGPIVSNPTQSTVRADFQIIEYVNGSPVVRVDRTGAQALGPLTLPTAPVFATQEERQWWYDELTQALITWISRVAARRYPNG